MWWDVCNVESCVDVSDIRKINDLAVNAINTGILILGGGTAKHHICNANLMVCSHFPSFMIIPNP